MSDRIPFLSQNLSIIRLTAVAMEEAFLLQHSSLQIEVQSRAAQAAADSSSTTESSAKQG